MKHAFKIQLFFLALIIATATNCDKKEKTSSNKFTITGKFLTPYNDSIFFSYGSKKDCTVVKNNTFRFEGTLDSIDQRDSYFYLKNPGSMATVFLDTGNITIDFDHTKNEAQPPNTYLFVKKAEGSLNHKIWDNYTYFWRENHKKENYAELVVLNLKKNMDSFPKSPINGRILKLNANDILSASQIKEVKNVIDTTSMFRWDLINTNTVLKAKIRTQKGTRLKNFALKNTEGKIENFYSLNNKFTIIDFWASWCSPCREENKQLPLLAQKYGDKLEIINISIDDDEEEWKKAVEKDNLIWKNYITDNDWDSEICNYYGIVSVPSKLFIDKDGKFLGYNLSYQQIEGIMKKE